MPFAQFLFGWHCVFWHLQCDHSKTSRTCGVLFGQVPILRVFRKSLHLKIFPSLNRISHPPYHLSSIINRSDVADDLLFIWTELTWAELLPVVVFYKIWHKLPLYNIDWYSINPKINHPLTSTTMKRNNANFHKHSVICVRLEKKH